MAMLYVMVGIPGSGKSYEAQKIVDSHTGPITYISRDEVRLATITDQDHYFSKEDEVYDKFIKLIAEQLAAGNDVIADATHMSRGSRRKLIESLAREGMCMNKYDITYVCMNTPLEVCIERDSHRTGRRHVTEPVIRRMAKALSMPTVKEFSNVKEVIVRG